MVLKVGVLSQIGSTYLKILPCMLEIFLFDCETSRHFNDIFFFLYFIENSICPKMADDSMPTTYETKTTTHTTSSSTIGFHPEYLRTIPGILKIVECVS